MFRRVVVAAFALLLLLTGLAGGQPPVAPALLEADAGWAAADEARPGTLDDHHLDELPVRPALDLQDTQDLLVLVRHRPPVGERPGNPPAPPAVPAAPEPWLGTLQRPPRA